MAISKESVGSIMKKQVDPRALAAEKLKAYREFVIYRLREIALSIESGCLEDVFDKQEDLVRESPAGDCYGADNTYINFGYDEDGMDIKDALNLIAYLKIYSEGLYDIPIDMEYDEKISWWNETVAQKAIDDYAKDSD